MKNAITGVGMLAVLCGALFFAMKSPAFSTRDTGSAASSTANMRMEEIREETASYKITVDYPQFRIDPLDRDIRSYVMNSVDQFKENVAGAPLAGGGTFKNEFELGVGSEYVTPELISVLLGGWMYTGGAHGIPFMYTIAYDPERGEYLSLNDVLSLIGLSLEEVAVQSRAQILEHLAPDFGEDILFEDGLRPLRENFAIFSIDEDSVDFSFPVYQVAPYVAGPQAATFARVK